MGIEAALPHDSILTTQFNRVVNWARRSSVWPLPFATACCGIELMATACSRFDLSRFGAEVMRFSPRQADLLIVAGRVGIKSLPVLQRIYMQMAEPKWVISMGACASTGGVFDTYAVVQGIDQFLPVDVYVPGCPPRPEMLLEGIMAIQRIIDEDNIPTDGNGKRIPLSLALDPTHHTTPQPLDVSIGDLRPRSVTERPNARNRQLAFRDRQPRTCPRPAWNLRDGPGIHVGIQQVQVHLNGKKASAATASRSMPSPDFSTASRQAVHDPPDLNQHQAIDRHRRRRSRWTSGVATVQAITALSCMKVIASGPCQRSGDANWRSRSWTRKPPPIDRMSRPPAGLSTMSWMARSRTLGHREES